MSYRLRRSTMTLYRIEKDRIKKADHQPGYGPGDLYGKDTDLLGGIQALYLHGCLGGDGRAFIDPGMDG